MTDKPTLFTAPFKTLYIFGLVTLNFLIQALTMLLKLWYLVALLALVLIVPRFLPGEHLALYSEMDEIGYFMAYWILLGIASSVGLGNLVT